MKTVVALFCTALIGASYSQASSPSKAPQGTVLELHSCELYAGGCTVSSEATQGGRYMFRAWNFTAGEFGGIPLAGLKLAVLQTSASNLASPEGTPSHGVVYLPEQATPEQRSALLSWLKASEPNLTSGLEYRSVSLEMQARDSAVQVRAGDFVAVKTASLESCRIGSCGEALWYSPRSANTVYTVAVNLQSKVTEPMLQLKWEDAGKRSVFLGKFGEEAPAKNIYVSLAEVCGPGGKLF